jgi:hypothetical protein
MHLILRIVDFASHECLPSYTLKTVFRIAREIPMGLSPDCPSTVSSPSSDASGIFLSGRTVDPRGPTIGTDWWCWG